MITHGACCVWSLSVPEAELDTIQSDYDHLMWARDPHLRQTPSPNCNSTGTARTHRAYIHRRASPRARYTGGANVMSVANHATAARASWMLYYLSPRQAAWKRMLDSIIGIESAE